MKLGLIKMEARETVALRLAVSGLPPFKAESTSPTISGRCLSAVARQQIVSLFVRHMLTPALTCMVVAGGLPRQRERGPVPAVQPQHQREPKVSGRGLCLLGSI